MGSTATAVLVVMLLAFALSALVWHLRRAARHTNRILREIHERAETARQVDDLELLYSLPAYEPADPELDAGCDRLWDEVRREQQKGETP